LQTNVLHYYLTFLSPARYARDPFLPIPISSAGNRAVGVDIFV
jgi:hypothetical protein